MAIYSEIFPLKIVIFHSYVSLPEGKQYIAMFQFQTFHHLRIDRHGRIPM